jgi:hypothetical protein
MFTCIALSVRIVIFCCVQTYNACLLVLPCPSGLCFSVVFKLIMHVYLYCLVRQDCVLILYADQYFIFMTVIDINKTYSLFVLHNDHNVCFDFSINLQLRYCSICLLILILLHFRSTWVYHRFLGGFLCLNR